MNKNSFLFAYTATTTLMWLSHQNKLAFSRNDPRSMHDFTHCFRILLVNVRVYTHHASLLRLPFSLFFLSFPLSFSLSFSLSSRFFYSPLKYVNAIWQHHSVILTNGTVNIFLLCIIHIYSSILFYSNEWKQI